jgi:NADH-quinone oxidoreductase subunit N
MFSPIYLEAAVLVLGLLLLLYEAFSSNRNKTKIAWSAIVGLGVILIASLLFYSNPDFAPLSAASAQFYRFDATALFFKCFALTTTIIVLVMGIEYKEVVRRFIFGAEESSGMGEFFALPVFTCAGLMWMASAVDFVLIFVSLELVTISFYVLVAYMRRNLGSLEAGVKYLILGALSTGFLVYGITWVFGLTGSTNLFEISQALTSSEPVKTPLLFGLMLIIIALGFKVAATPFQFWVPDVYQGAPTPITAFLSVGSKAAGFIVLVRVLTPLVDSPAVSSLVLTLLAVIAGMTLIYGNLAAMPQNNLKRLLAYSSIAHAGYLLVAVASLNSKGAFDAIVFYLAAYLLMTLLSFTVMIVVSKGSATPPGDDITNYNGLGKRSPFLAFGMLIAMLSLAGVPFTAGFFGKFLVFAAAVQAQHWVLVAIGIITVGAGFYYYLKVVRAMYWQDASQETPIQITPITRTTISVLAALIILLGIYPRPVFNLLQFSSINAPSTQMTVNSGDLDKRLLIATE